MKLPLDIQRQLREIKDDLIAAEDAAERTQKRMSPSHAVAREYRNGGGMRRGHRLLGPGCRVRVGGL